MTQQVTQLSEALRTWTPIAISLVSLLLAGVALGWNVYRDIVLKARVRVRFGVYRVVILFYHRALTEAL